MRRQHITVDKACLEYWPDKSRMLAFTGVGFHKRGLGSDERW